MTDDDSQDGLDHVDGHRTVGLAISPDVRHGIVESNFYTAVACIGGSNRFRLSPRNQFDLAAEPMFTPFTSKPDLTPDTAIPNRIALDEMNGLQRELAAFSMTIDSSEPDSAPADMLNRAIWHSVKGFNTPYNHGRPIRRGTLPTLSLLKLAGF